MKIVAKTFDAESTRMLASALAELATPCDLVVLCGDLGAGKTTFCQGFGRGLGVDEQITSPTFTLVRSYTGRLDLNHLDVYRLDQLGEVADLGLSELLDDDSVTLIEWGDQILPALPPDYLEVRLVLGDDDDERRIELTTMGHRWSARRRALSTAIAAWAAEDD